MDELAAGRVRMVELLERLDAPDGARASRIAGVTLLRASKSCAPVPVLYEPCIAIVARGTKRFHLPDRVVTYDAANYLTLTVPVPADCETIVADDGPFLAIAVGIDLNVLGELLLTLGRAIAVARTAAGTLRSSTTASMDAAVSRAAVRLMEALGSPVDAKVLGAQVVRELLYRVLCGPRGEAIRSLLLASESEAQIHRTLQRLHLEYAAPINLSNIARQAGLSTSAFHQHFREITGTSPVQYVKTIRLHKARMLMVQESIGAASAAERVGYESPSQFSREFKRFFGSSPALEAQRVRSAFGLADYGSAAAS